MPMEWRLWLRQCAPIFPWDDHDESLRRGLRRMVADVAEATVADVFATTILKAQAHALRRGRAMNNEEGNRTHGYLQAPKPKAPTMAVATVMITLRTIPHTDFDFFSSFMVSR